MPISRRSLKRSRAEYRVRSKVWHFAGLSSRQSQEIRIRAAADRRGWGSVPVTVRVGKTTWRTSLFPEKKSDCYLFALKADVRRREHIVAGDTITAVGQLRR